MQQQKCKVPKRERDFIAHLNLSDVFEAKDDPTTSAYRTSSSGHWNHTQSEQRAAELVSRNLKSRCIWRWYIAVAQSMKFQNYAHTHFWFLSPCLPTDSGRWAGWSKFQLACFLNSVSEVHSGSVTLASRHRPASFESGDLTSHDISPGTSMWYRHVYGVVSPQVCK